MSDGALIAVIAVGIAVVLAFLALILVVRGYWKRTVEAIDDAREVIDPRVEELTDQLAVTQRELERVSHAVEELSRDA